MASFKKDLIFNIEDVECPDLKMHLENIATFSVGILQHAAVFCNQSKSIDKEHVDIAIPDDFNIWEHSEILIETNRMGTSNMKLEYGSTITEVGDHKKGIYHQIQLGLEYRINAWQKALESCDVEDKAKYQRFINQASALSLALALGKLHLQSMIPETAALDSLKSCQEFISRCGDDTLKNDLVSDFNQFEELIKKHRYLHYDVSTSERHSIRDAKETYEKASNYYKHIKETIDASNLPQEAKEHMYEKIDYAFECFKNKNDLNLQVPLFKFSEEEYFEKFQDKAQKISLGLSTAALALTAASFSPAAPVTAPAAMALGLASLALTSPGIVKNIGGAIYNKAQYGISPTKGEVITGIMTPTLLALKTTPFPSHIASSTVNGVQKGITMAKNTYGVKTYVTLPNDGKRAMEETIKKFIDEFKSYNEGIIERKLDTGRYRLKLQEIKENDLSESKENSVAVSIKA
ncbi:hypothetical protein [Legionella longbeachae]|uniref:Uncharacterized protein n=1 Tax=Legionella longbeachae serogroup 1 (strain NSW150) TaxID=661367 RepID=D3HQ92_LEGLN|nr:hypothetical protein [Legionella longbeachae]VEE01578.1 Uncharacterised protein [Legionella oakridgensis]HBD7396339.1 hypothetical protein [Legionella pneumophila]ARB92075.1 hypothetical protein A6J40_07735 [Legionella longbeachae]ARM34743.1 hypothetical protein B0B39_14985 [Legionella longbeachae]EEZ95834.1 hypothetical protein LLB_1015 [Legionella longbeachae D-4968]